MAPDLGLGDPTAATPNEIPLEKKAGVLILPVMVNDGLPVDFVLDSGASDISMPAEMVEELVRSQGLTAADFTGQLVYQLADGTKVPSQTFRIRSLKLNGGDLT